MKYKPFQRQDYARLAMVDAAILGHDTGLGKTWAGYTYSLLKCGFARDGHRIVPKAPVLVVAPGDLHQQWTEEGAQNFQTHLVPLDCQDTFLSLSTLDGKGRRILPPGFYVTSYTALGHNGVRPMPNPDRLKTLDEVRAALAFLGESWDEARLQIGRDAQARNEFWTFDQLDFSQQLALAKQRVATRLSVVGDNVGQWPDNPNSESRNPNFRVRCVWDPTLADLCWDSFECVVVDEGTKLKGGFDTQIGTGVLQLNPRYRLICTATPIKNRLPNIFPLAWWACGGQFEPHARFPYTIEDADDFAKTFCVVEHNLSRERDATGSASKRRGRFSKLTPQVCNVHKVWKLFAPIVLRKRKKDIGEDMVRKVRQVYRVPMGTRQAAVYQAHLEWEPVDKNGKPSIGPKLQALRMAAAAPHSALLPQLRGPAYCPKLAAALTLIEQMLRQGKQVIVFSPFHDPLDELGRRLLEASVPREVLDGRVSQEKRGQAALRFKKRAFPVLLGSSESMAEGHSFPNCSRVIQYAYPWALDKVLQSEDRAWRLNSIEDLHVYRLITEGSIDRKMESQIDEKADAAELVLDGHLLGENNEELNLAELLRIAQREFSEARDKKTLDETILEAEWPGLRERLREAARQWAGTRQPVPFPALRVNWRVLWRQRQQLEANVR